METKGKPPCTCSNRGYLEVTNFVGCGRLAHEQCDFEPRYFIYLPYLQPKMNLSD